VNGQQARIIERPVIFSLLTFLPVLTRRKNPAMASKQQFEI